MKSVCSFCVFIFLINAIAYSHTIDHTIWKVNEYPFDYYYGYYDYQFYLRYDGDDWWQWNKGFPLTIGLSLFFDCPFGMSFGFAYGEATDMYHYQYIIFDNKEESATSWCYRLIKNPKPGEDFLISYVLTLHKIYDDWDGVSPPPEYNPMILETVGGYENYGVSEGNDLWDVGADYH